MGLKEYVIRRLILVFPIVLGAILLVFAITQLFPASQRAALYVRSERDIGKLDEFVAKYRLNASALDQFVNWFTQVLQGNFGYSRNPYGRGPVLQVMMQKWPATIELAICIAPITILLGVFLGTKSAVYRDKPFDHATRLLSISGYSVPSFWLGMILISITIALTGWMPIHRVSTEYKNIVSDTSLFTTYTGFYTIDGILNGLVNGRPYGYEVTLDAIKHMILPVVVVTTINVAGLIRLMRSSMLEALTKGYIITARAKGLKRSEVINRHARRNALIPVVTVSGMMVAGLMSGLVITETVFNFSGIGQWAAAAATGVGGAPDVPSIVGFTFFTAFLFIFSNLIVDILYAYIDPRIRLG